MRYSLGFVLALSLAGLQFLAILIVVSTSYVSSERAMLDHARGLLGDASQSAIDHTRTFLDPAREAAELASRIIENEIVDASDPETLERFLFRQLQIEPQLSGIYYGDEAGNFTYVMRSDGPGPYRTKFIGIEDDIRTIELIWRTDEEVAVEREFEPEDTFDPRARQWYIDAAAHGDSVWTEPYIFFSSQQPGITVAHPVTDEDGTLRGVVGVDIEISEISSFLASLSIGTEGIALILNEDGRVVAHPKTGNVTVQNEDGIAEFVEIADIEDPITRAAFSDFGGAGDVTEMEEQFEFKFENETFMAVLEPISGIELPWTISVFAPENDFIRGIKDNRRRNIWIAALISLLTAIVGLALAELILKPVRAFAVRTSLVSQGEMSAEDPLPRTYRELRDANQTLIQEIAQRRSLDAKVHDLNRELSHASRVNTMGQLATGLAHELSQPLTAITQNVDTAISIAKQDETPRSELLHVLSELDEQAHQGGDIIRSLRGFVRKDVRGTEAFDLSDLVSQTCRLMRQDIETHRVHIAQDFPTLPPVVGNRVETAQVLTNLIRNAIEAMVAAETAKRSIEISAKVVEAHVELSVADTGPGVDPDVTLFKQFQTSKTDGLGLGLSISRAIVEANNGRLWYDARTDGGSRFVFTIPLHQTSDQATAT